MSVQAFLDHQQLVRNLIAATPTCWAIVANSVHAQAEHEAVVAVFDTQAQAEAYVEASLLPADWDYARRNILERSRAFRPDSLLWEYNNTRGAYATVSRSVSEIPLRSSAIVVALTNPFVSITGEGIELSAAINPTPPSGPMADEVFAEDVARRLRE